MRVHRIAWLISGAGLVAFLASMVWLADLKGEGPAHADVMLEGGVSGTLYLPRAQTESVVFAVPAPGEPRPPGVVLMHGFALDRRSLSGLARALAGAGYAVLCIDAPGHGENRAPFDPIWGRTDGQAQVFESAVDFLRLSPYVDGRRIAVGGHSMGASAALDYASRDSGLDATLLISGGREMGGPYRPPNVLLVIAESDPPETHSRLSKIAAKLAGEAALPERETRGDLSLGRAVRRVVVPDTDHMGVVFSAATAEEVVAWLDGSLGIDRSGPLSLADPRLLAFAFAMLGALLVLPGLGMLVGRLVPRLEALPAAGALAWVTLVLSLFAVLPLVAGGKLMSFLSLEVGDVIVSWLFLSGVAILTLLALRGQLADLDWTERPLRSLLGAGLGFLGMTILMQPLHEVAHGMTLSASRAGVFVLVALWLMPFTLGFQLLLRRGSPLQAGLNCALGRLVVLATIALSVRLVSMNSTVTLMLGVIALVMFSLEIFAAGVYARSRNRLVIALVEALWIGWISALALPLRG